MAHVAEQVRGWERLPSSEQPQALGASRPLATWRRDTARMSENVDLVRSIYADWERGDFSRADWADPQIQFDVIGSVGPTEPRKGLAGMARGFRDFLSTWADYRVQADEYRELDAERVLVLVHATSGRAKTSGVDIRRVRTNGATLHHIRDGKVTRLVIYPYADRALADLGLEG
jgi:ketosteroid isomerase-like protein